MLEVLTVKSAYPLHLMFLEKEHAIEYNTSYHLDGYLKSKMNSLLLSFQILLRLI